MSVKAAAGESKISGLISHNMLSLEVMMMITSYKDDENEIYTPLVPS